MTTLKERAKAASKKVKEKIEEAGDTLGDTLKVVGVAATTAFTLGTGNAQAQELHMNSDGSFTYTEATTPRTTSPRSSGATITYQQASQNYQAVFNSLSPYAQQRVTDLGLQNQIITRYNTATGLNRPEDGIIYACAVPDPAIPGNVMFIPVEEALYKAGARNPTPVPTISVPAQDAEIMMTRPNQRNFSPSRDGTSKTYSQNNNPMYSHVEYMVTLENGIRTLRTENYQRDQLAREQTKAQTGGLRRANDRVREWNNQVRRANQNVKQAERNVKDIGRTIGRLGRW